VVEEKASVRATGFQTVDSSIVDMEFVEGVVRAANPNPTTRECSVNPTALQLTVTPTPTAGEDHLRGPTTDMVQPPDRDRVRHDNREGTQFTPV